MTPAIENNNEEVNEIKRHWFALYTKPRQEFKAASDLETGGINYYLPSVTRVSQWSDRKKKITEPLIRGYIFIQATEKERLLALEQHSIVRCVSFSGKIATIPDWQIENLKIMLNAENEVAISDLYEVGTYVKVVSGPLTGLIGVVKESPNGKTISIIIDMLKRSVTASLSAEDIIKIVPEDEIPKE